MGAIIILSLFVYSSWLGLTSGRPQHEFWPDGIRCMIFWAIQMVVLSPVNALFLHSLHVW
jgi:hypothetical protein